MESVIYTERDLEVWMSKGADNDYLWIGIDITGLEYDTLFLNILALLFLSYVSIDLPN